jgi:hypothetical protein
MSYEADLAELILTDKAKSGGASWAVIGLKLGKSKKVAKRDAKRLAKRTRRLAWQQQNATREPVLRKGAARMSGRGRPRTIILEPDCRFGRLKVITEARSKPRPGRPNGLPAAGCLCDCGNTTVVLVSDLISGNTASCGCLQVDRRQENGARQVPALIAMNRTPENRERMRQLALAGRVGIRKLDHGKAAEIRAEYALGGISQAALAVKYHVNPRTIWCVLNGKAWTEPACEPVLQYDSRRDRDR